MAIRAVPLLALALLAGCATAENPIYTSGIGSPARGLALEAPFVFGRTESLSGDPIRAARAARDIEGFTYLLENDPLAQTTRDATLQPKLQIARRELRGALGITANVPGDVAADRFGIVLAALAANDLPTARAAADSLGGPGTFERLAALPRLPRVEEAAAALANEAGQDRNPRSGRGRG